MATSSGHRIPVAISILHIERIARYPNPSIPSVTAVLVVIRCRCRFGARESILRQTLFSLRTAIDEYTYDQAVGRTGAGGVLAADAAGSDCRE
jgi:hypothetical protein